MSGDERWIKGKRRDGLAIVEGLDGAGYHAGAEGLPVDKCPFCDRRFPMTASRQARGAAGQLDMLYPMTDG